MSSKPVSSRREQSCFFFHVYEKSNEGTNDDIVGEFVTLTISGHSSDWL